jgi:pyruvate/2-oxoglutarate/acetoin dehydrogenase E1 component/5-methylcytosine-specific restriction endonuclease McrA
MYGKSKQLRFVYDTPLIPIGYAQHQKQFQYRGYSIYKANDREQIHTEQKAVPIENLKYLVANPARGQSAEYNDNRISLYVGQYGKCYVLGNTLDVDEIHCHHKKPRALNGKDEYKNLVIVHLNVHRLIHATDNETINRYTNLLELNAEQLENIEKEAKKIAKDGQKKAWENYRNSIEVIKNEVLPLVENLKSQNYEVEAELQKFGSLISYAKKDVFSLMRKVLLLTRTHQSTERQWLASKYQQLLAQEKDNYSSHLYSESECKSTNVKEVKPIYSENSEMVDGRVVVRNNFDKIFEKYPETLVFGEDAGNIGDVNQGLEGLQEKYGKVRVADTGIREATILGQGIGMAMRGLRPIAEIQYLDYILYCLQGISDDLATLHYRTKGGQKAPVIIRTRGHRLEGIWHSGSPMAGIINLVKGVNVLVPRNLTKAAGFYNTMLQSDEPAIIVETLNGYRLKEKQPDNLGEFTVPVGKIEVTKEGKDVTLVTYGSTWRLVMEAAEELEKLGISAEVIDIQSLIPFDISHEIAESVKKTNRLVIIDEDVEGGTSAFILQQIVEKQKAFRYLDSAPLTIAANDHRPAYASDGDYFSKPSVDDIVEKVYGIFHEANPSQFPKI